MSSRSNLKEYNIAVLWINSSINIINVKLEEIVEGNICGSNMTDHTITVKTTIRQKKNSITTTKYIPCLAGALHCISSSSSLYKLTRSGGWDNLRASATTSSSDINFARKRGTIGYDSKMKSNLNKV